MVDAGYKLQVACVMSGFRLKRDAIKCRGEKVFTPTF